MPAARDLLPENRQFVAEAFNFCCELAEQAAALTRDQP
jgi:hypothetical protein